MYCRCQPGIQQPQERELLGDQHSQASPSHGLCLVVINNWLENSGSFSSICSHTPGRSPQVICPLTLELSVYARDAMAKAVYGRTFTWLVNKINSSLVNQVGQAFGVTCSH